MDFDFPSTAAATLPRDGNGVLLIQQNEGRHFAETALLSRPSRESRKCFGGSNRKTPISFPALNCFDGVPDHFEPHDERQRTQHSCHEEDHRRSLLFAWSRALLRGSD